MKGSQSHLLSTPQILNYYENSSILSDISNNQQIKLDNYTLCDIGEYNNNSGSSNTANSSIPFAFSRSHLLE